MDEIKNYEVSYLITSSVAEGEVLNYANKLASIIEASKGAIKYTESPKKRKLAYPVKKERGAYFGWTTFSASPQSLAAIEKGIKPEKGLLRYLIVDKTREELQLKPVYFSIPRPVVTRPAGPQAAEKAPEEKLDLEALDKKLEEILGK